VVGAATPVAAVGGVAPASAFVTDLAAGHLVLVAEIKALACELPAQTDVPLARWSCPELAREAVTRGVCERVPASTVRRWLAQDATKPWQHRPWIFPRDPYFAIKAARVLDLYARVWEGERLSENDFVLSAATRMNEAWPTAHMAHLPVHTSWLSQAEVYFSTVQRKALTPDDFEDLDEVAERLLSCQERYTITARPCGRVIVRRSSARRWIA
jgi:hypothetical protein